MRFLVDGMLGGLARWLRILGYEVRYDANAQDSDLLAIAIRESMILLTRDKELYRRAVAKKVASALLQSEGEVDRLAQLAVKFGVHLEANMSESKCPECGSDLREKSKSDVTDVVPRESLKLYRQFWKCTSQNCGKAYWIGSHWKQIRKTLEEARKLARLEAL